MQLWWWVNEGTFGLVLLQTVYNNIVYAHIYVYIYIYPDTVALDPAQNAKHSRLPVFCAMFQRLFLDGLRAFIPGTFLKAKRGTCDEMFRAMFQLICLTWRKVREFWNSKKVFVMMFVDVGLESWDGGWGGWGGGDDDVRCWLGYDNVRCWWLRNMIMVFFVNTWRPVWKEYRYIYIYIYLSIVFLILFGGTCRKCEWSLVDLCLPLVVSKFLGVECSKKALDEHVEKPLWNVKSCELKAWATFSLPHDRGLKRTRRYIYIYIWSPPPPWTT